MWSFTLVLKFDDIIMAVIGPHEVGLSAATHSSHLLDGSYGHKEMITYYAFDLGSAGRADS